MNTLSSILDKKLYWQSAYCTVQTSYGLWSRISMLRMKRTQYTYIHNISITSHTVWTVRFIMKTTDRLMSSNINTESRPADSRDDSWASSTNTFAVVLLCCSVCMYLCFGLCQTPYEIWSIWHWQYLNGFNQMGFLKLVLVNLEIHGNKQCRTAHDVWASKNPKMYSTGNSLNKE